MLGINFRSKRVQAMIILLLQWLAKVVAAVSTGTLTEPDVIQALWTEFGVIWMAGGAGHALTKGNGNGGSQ